ncbi:Spindle assembly checkpoint component MAD1 [Abortiporus biennis]
MDNDKFSTPINFNSRLTSIRSTASKRDSLAAELERDPQLSTAKRKQRVQAFSSHMTQASMERQLASLQAVKSEMEAKLREKDALIERLEGDRRWLAEREKEERDEKERERKEREEEKRKSDSDIRALRNSFIGLREQYEDLKDENTKLSRQSSQTINSQNSKIATLSRQVELLEKEVKDLNTAAEERNHAFEELQAQFDELSEGQDANKSIASVAAEDESWSIVREELHRQANHLRTVEAANAKMNVELNMLRQRHASIEVLKEQKYELERKLEGMDKLKEKLVKLEGELEAARREREEWATSAAQTPVSLTQNLSSLRSTYARLLEEHGSNTALLKQREIELADSEARAKELQSTVEELESNVDTLKEKVLRDEQRASLAEREVGFLQAMVASFTAEESTQDGASHRVDEAAVQRVQQLETLLTEYKSTVSKLEAEVSDLGGDPTTLGQKRRGRKDILAELNEEKTKRQTAETALKESEESTIQHLETIDKLEQTLFELQGEIGGGRHVPPGVRILSLKENPASQWEDLSRKAMERVKEENEALLKRLKELEEGGVRVEGGSNGHAEGELVPRESWEVVNKEKEELEESLKQKDKRLLRLKQVFSAKSEEFKEAIASILGVKLAFYPNGQVRVTSRFDLTTAFVFQPTKPSAGGTSEGMTMKLVAQGEGGPEDLPQLMRYWVEEEQCIPGFLASVTLECYEKMKREEHSQGM